MTSIDLMRHRMPDFYTAYFFSPKDKQQALHFLLSFYIELDRIAETVSEPMVGEIKLQWWRDALQNAKAGNVSGHPIADGFAKVMQDYSLPPLHVSNLIDARSFDISGEHMPDWPALKVYIDKTYGSLFLLSAYILDHRYEDKKTLEKLSRCAGLAYGLAHLLHSLPTHAVKGQLYLPVSRFEDFDITVESLLQGQEAENLQEMLRDFHKEIIVAFEETRVLLKDVSLSLVPAILPLSLVKSYLKKLSHSTHRPLHDLVHINPMHRLFNYWLMSGFGKV